MTNKPTCKRCALKAGHEGPHMWINTRRIGQFGDCRTLAPTEDTPPKPEPDSRDWWQQVAASLGVRVFDLERQLAQLKIDACNCPNQNNLCPVHDSEKAIDLLRPWTESERQGKISMALNALAQRRSTVDG